MIRDRSILLIPECGEFDPPPISMLTSEPSDPDDVTPCWESTKIEVLRRAEMLKGRHTVSCIARHSIPSWWDWSVSYVDLWQEKPVLDATYRTPFVQSAQTEDGPMSPIAVLTVNGGRRFWTRDFKLAMALLRDNAPLWPKTRAEHDLKPHGQPLG